MKDERSRKMKSGLEKAPHRSLLYALGLTREEINRPLVGVVNAANEVVPGHMHLDKLAEAVKAGVRMAGGTPLEFPAIAVCDGLAMNHEGMRFSLPSREFIADSIEIMARAHAFDALVFIPNCDKCVPGMLMAMMRLNIPSILVSGGPQRFDYHRQIRRGAERAIRDFGLIPIAQELREEIQVNETDSSFMAATVEWARRVLEYNPRPEAVFCSGSFPGRALAMVALEKRIPIPSELKIVTVGIVNAGSGSYPELTSLEHDYTGMMGEAFGILERIWNGEEKEGIEVRVEPELVVQASTVGELPAK